MREKPVTIEVRKNGQHWAVLAEEQLIALTVYEKGAHTLEATLRGLLRYTSRKLFRQAVSDAMKGPKQAAVVKGPKAEKTRPAPATKKLEKAGTKKSASKKAASTSGAPDIAPPAPPTQTSQESAAATPTPTNSQASD